MYNKGLNNYILNNFNKYEEITKEINDFFNHITLITNNISEIISEEINIKDKKFDLSMFKEFYNSKINISIIVICKDEERCIKRCLNSIIPTLDKEDELLVIDTGSQDNTLNILKKDFKNINILHKKWNNNFSEVRNIGIDKAKNQWIFFIDADEILESNSIINLKKYLRVIKFMNLKNIVINPTIVNHNSHIVKGVRRIIKKEDNIKYYGVIHEEPRLKIDMYGKDIDSISFDNIILSHDGYKEEIISNKNKNVRNIKLLKKMINREPNYPRWMYFYCRDGKSLINKNEYENCLDKVILLCKNDKYYEEYKIRALSDLIELNISNGYLEKAEDYLLKLKNISNNISDIFYFEKNIAHIKLKMSNYLLLQESIEYRKNKDYLDYGSIHSSYFHIDYLIARLFFEIGEYEKCFNILIQLENNGYKGCENNYKSLYKSINKYFNIYNKKNKVEIGV